LIYLYDNNEVTLDTAADESYTEDWAQRFDAYGWHVQQIDGMDSAAVTGAITAAQADPRPSIIGCRTIIGFGSPNKAGTSKAHGEALGEEELALTKQNLGWPLEPRFLVPNDVQAYFRQAVARGKELEAEYSDRFEAYSQQYPQEANELRHMLAGELPEGWQAALPTFSGKPDATRNASGKTLNELAKVIPNLIGGSADLAGSNKTTINDFPFVQAGNFATPNFRFGVREHGMGGALNGMALHGGVIPYGGTFLVFTDYMRASIRLAALMGLHIIYVMTHDSIGLGEDGPTHQPVEHLAALRAMPNLTVIRPADANETAHAWQVAAQQLAAEGVGVRVVSLASWELFARQSDAYRQEVLPPDTPKLAIEAAATFGWERWVGNDKSQGDIIGIDHFGASAPYQRIYQGFGLTTEHLVERARLLLAKG
jgi:transketolase